MKIRSLALEVLILLALLAGPGAVLAQATDPVSLVQAYATAVNAGNADAAAALFAADGVRTVVPPPAGQSGVYTGPDQILALTKIQVAAHAQIDQTGFQVSGDTVTWTINFCNDRYRKDNICPVQFNGVAVVQNGKFTSFTTTQPPESLARVRAAEGTTPTAAPTAAPGMPATGGGLRPAYPLLIALGVLGLLLGLNRRRAS